MNTGFDFPSDNLPLDTLGDMMDHTGMDFDSYDIGFTKSYDPAEQLAKLKQMRERRLTSKPTLPALPAPSNDPLMPTMQYQIAPPPPPVPISNYTPPQPEPPSPRRRVKDATSHPAHKTKASKATIAQPEKTPLKSQSRTRKRVKLEEPTLKQPVTLVDAFSNQLSAKPKQNRKRSCNVIVRPDAGNTNIPIDQRINAQVGDYIKNQSTDDNSNRYFHTYPYPTNLNELFDNFFHDIATSQIRIAEERESYKKLKTESKGEVDVKQILKNLNEKSRTEIEKVIWNLIMSLIPVPTEYVSAWDMIREKGQLTCVLSFLHFLHEQTGNRFRPEPDQSFFYYCLDKNSPLPDITQPEAGVYIKPEHFDSVS